MKKEKLLRYEALTQAFKEHKYKGYITEQQYKDVAQPIFADLDLSDPFKWRHFVKGCTLKGISFACTFNTQYNSEKFKKYGKRYYIC